MVFSFITASYYYAAKLSFFSIPKSYKMGSHTFKHNPSPSQHFKPKTTNHHPARNETLGKIPNIE